MVLGWLHPVARLSKFTLGMDSRRAFREDGCIHKCAAEKRVVSVFTLTRLPPVFIVPGSKSEHFICSLHKLFECCLTQNLRKTGGQVLATGGQLMFLSLHLLSPGRIMLQFRMRQWQFMKTSSQSTPTSLAEAWENVVHAQLYTRNFYNPFSTSPQGLKENYDSEKRSVPSLSPWLSRRDRIFN